MTEAERAAIAAFATDMSSAFDRLATALGVQVSTTRTTPLYSRVTSAMPWNERLLRQALVLHDISAAGGNVAQSVWYEIAAKYGYAGRGLAGFFRGDAQGLLEMRESRGNSRVYITKRGKERLAQQKERVADAIANEKALADAAAGPATAVKRTKAEAHA